jgi:hypothetical protein
MLPTSRAEISQRDSCPTLGQASRGHRSAAYAIAPGATTACNRWTRTGAVSTRDRCLAIVWSGRCARYQNLVESREQLWQPSLFAQGEAYPDPDFSGLVRHQLDPTAWVDHVPGWLEGADALFEDLLHSTPWEATTQEDISALPPVIERMRQLLVARYGRPFDSVGANLYRDGRDSVAWHGDHIPVRIVDPVVATVSLGHPRRFAMKPREGKTGLSLALGMGDLVVMGGSSQRTWLHTVPKVASAGPRISVAFRHSTG